MYFDSAYIAKFYLTELDSYAVRRVLRRARQRISSAWAMAEVISVFHRHVCSGTLSSADQNELAPLFLEHTAQGVCIFVPVDARMIRATVDLVKGLPASVSLRAGDAVHIATALQVGESAIWASDRHLLAAARHCGLMGLTA